MSWGDPNSIEPLGDRILVETLDEEEKTAAGIVLPENLLSARPERARVLAVGPGPRDSKTQERVPMDIQVGDEVIFHRHAGVHIGGFDDHYIIFREQDILARVRP